MPGSKASAYRELVERFGAERVADAVLEAWLADPAGTAGFERLAAMVRLEGQVTLSHLAGIDADYLRAPTSDGYVLDYRVARRRREAA